MFLKRIGPVSPLTELVADTTPSRPTIILIMCGVLEAVLLIYMHYKSMICDVLFSYDSVLTIFR